MLMKNENVYKPSETATTTASKKYVNPAMMICELKQPLI